MQKSFQCSEGAEGSRASGVSAIHAAGITRKPSGRAPGSRPRSEAAAALSRPALDRLPRSPRTTSGPGPSGSPSPWLPRISSLRGGGTVYRRPTARAAGASSGIWLPFPAALITRLRFQHGLSAKLARAGADGTSVLPWKGVQVRVGYLSEVRIMPDFKLGDPLDEKAEGLVKMPPPVVLSVQPNSFVPLQTPEQLRAWEAAVRLTTGVEIVADNLAGRACETGSNFGEACNSDDSGLT